jgi:squalene-hopene/tetraprenyl-beta-curcumene cyclase
MLTDTPTLNAALDAARQRLLSGRTAEGHWVGRLSSSALSTATAAWALHLVDCALGTDHHTPLVRRAVLWLAGTQNEDGGWGDTPESPSNISTTLLAWSALGASPDGTQQFAKTLDWCEAWVARRAGSLNPHAIAAAVHSRYGNDRTFSAPILTMCALAGLLGPETSAWGLVPPLPFELAAMPHRLLKWLRLPVVSYALPALISIGQVRFHFRPPINPLTWSARAAVRNRTLDTLTRIQPPSGGFLEAAPLTSFVAMSLAAIDLADHPVTEKAAAFLAATVLEDGSWPIDTNLATWTTSLSTAALGDDLPEADRPAVRDWLLRQQHRVEHPFTHAAPGGWAWTDLSGGVPDADDTAGALVALRALEGHAPSWPQTDSNDRTRRPYGQNEETREAAAQAVAWLLDLQNRDGGIPTFCRGWGKLPFDRSAADLTAHALAAWAAWREDLPPGLARRVDAASQRALAFLKGAQWRDGAWVPLWFGNQWNSSELNPTYGTARVVSALDGLARAGDPTAVALATKGAAWLVKTQGWNGGWGGAPAVAPSIEETALSLDALARVFAGGYGTATPSRTEIEAAIDRGTDWLLKRTDFCRSFEPAPIGLYFAKLWYDERLYPIIFTLSALRQVRRAIVGV